MKREWPAAGPQASRRVLLASVAACGMLAASGGAGWAATTYGPENTVTIVDPSPVNWLSVTWNTMEEPLRVDEHGMGQPSLATSWRWVNPTTLELKLREGVVYQDGTPYTAQNMKTAFDRVQDVTNPHPPGAFLNFAPDTKLEVVDRFNVRMTFPEGDSAALMKLRGMHEPSNAFWEKLGFVNKATGSATGHW